MITTVNSIFFFAILRALSRLLKTSVMPKRLVYHVIVFTMFPGKMALVELSIVKDFRKAKTALALPIVEGF